MARRSRKVVGPEENSMASGIDDWEPAVIGAGEAELRRMAARRRLEQYLESRRLNQHLREVFYDDER